MKAVGVIPARFESTRFPGKPLAKINGKEMILWVAEGAKQSKLLSDVYVATDDERIARIVEKHGFKFVMTDSSLPTGSDRIWAAVKDKDFDIIVNIQGDEPLVNGALIDSLIQPMLNDSNVQMSTLAHPLSETELNSENSVKVILNKNSEAIYFSRFAIPFSREKFNPQKASGQVLKHIGMYGYKKTFLKQYCESGPTFVENAESLEQLRALYLGARIKIIQTDYRSWGVDVPSDIQIIEQKLKERLKG